jgi:hypothetical protein
LTLREAILPAKVSDWRAKLSTKAKQEKRLRFYSLYGLISHAETLKGSGEKFFRSHGRLVSLGYDRSRAMRGARIAGLVHARVNRRIIEENGPFAWDGFSARYAGQCRIGVSPVVF